MSFSELAAEVQGNLASLQSNVATFTGAGIDSRTVNEGELFICIRGENNDGHQFIEQALKRGAIGVMTDVSFEYSNRLAERTNVVIVKNTHEAMMLLAQNYRRKVGAKIIGITGSNGKTTTKEFAYALLKAAESKAYRSPGNLNNLFGAPLALFTMPQDTKAAAIEMGISSDGEMTRLTEIVKPDVALITNIGPSHLEFLSTVEDVARAKLEMVTTSQADLPVVINADDQKLVNETAKVRNNVVTFGIKNKARYMPEVIKQTATGSMVIVEGNDFAISLFGQHQVYNLLAAYAACRTLGYDFSKIDTSKIGLNAPPMRGEVISKDGVTIIDDSYNANPKSVIAGIEGLNNVPAGGRRILIIGDMLELGRESEEYHRELGKFLSKQEFAIAIIVGHWSKCVIEGALDSGAADSKLYSFDNVREASAEIAELIKAGDVVYLKGSRGVGLERLIDKIGTGGGGD